jgi:hypothetical protein
MTNSKAVANLQHASNEIEISQITDAAAAD